MSVRLMRLTLLALAVVSAPPARAQFDANSQQIPVGGYPQQQVWPQMNQYAGQAPMQQGWTQFNNGGMQQQFQQPGYSGSGGVWQPMQPMQQPMQPMQQPMTNQFGAGTSSQLFQGQQPAAGFGGNGFSHTQSSFTPNQAPAQLDFGSGLMKGLTAGGNFGGGSSSGSTSSPGADGIGGLFNMFFGGNQQQNATPAPAKPPDNPLQSLLKTFLPGGNSNSNSNGGNPANDSEASGNAQQNLQQALDQASQAEDAQSRATYGQKDMRSSAAEEAQNYANEARAAADRATSAAEGHPGASDFAAQARAAADRAQAAAEQARYNASLNN